MGLRVSIIFLGASALLMQGVAALFACVGLALSYFLARRVRYGGWILRLILSGIAVSALFSAGVGVLKYLADPLTELPDIVFWMLGGLWGVTWIDFLYLLLPVIVGLVIVYLMRWRLNLLSLDDDTGFSLGASPGRSGRWSWSLPWLPPRRWSRLPASWAGSACSSPTWPAA